MAPAELVCVSAGMRNDQARFNENEHRDHYGDRNRCNHGSGRPWGRWFVHAHQSFPGKTGGNTGRPLSDSSPSCSRLRTCLVPWVQLPDNGHVNVKRVVTVGLAIAAAAGAVGCTPTADVNRPAANVAQVPNPTQIKHFDLVGYDRLHPNSASVSRLLGACVTPDHGRIVQMGVAQQLSKLGIARRGESVALLFQSGSTTTQRKAVAQCLRTNGASLVR